jgi:O-antigen/teichoic acid export membrane protein
MRLSVFPKFGGPGEFSNSVSSVGVRAVSGITRIGILLAIARAYGPESFGKLSLAVSIVEILRAFSDLGIDTVSIRKFTQNAAERRIELLESLLGAKLLVSACFYILAVGMVFFLANFSIALLAVIAGLSIFFSSALGSFLSYLQSCLSISRILKPTLVSSSVALIFAWLTIHKHAPLMVVIAALPLADALNLMLFCATSEFRFQARYDLDLTLDTLRESLPVGITSALVILYFRLDTVFVFKFAGAAALGLYAACFRVIEPALMIPNSFSTTAYTILSRLEWRDDSFRRAIRVVWQMMWPAFTAVAVFATLTLLAGRMFLARLFPAYLAGYPIMAVLSLTLVVRAVNMGLTAIFNSRAYYLTVTRIAAVNLTLNLVLVFFLAQWYGAFGAACAAFLTELLNTLIQGRTLTSVLHAPKNRLVTLENA